MNDLTPDAEIEIALENPLVVSVGNIPPAPGDRQMTGDVVFEDVTPGAGVTSGSVAAKSEGTDSVALPARGRVSASHTMWLASTCIALGLMQLPLAIGAHLRAQVSLKIPVAVAVTPTVPIVSAVSASASSLPVASVVVPTEPRVSLSYRGLGRDPRFEIAQGFAGKKGCEAALLALGLDKPEVLKISTSLAGVHKLGGCDRTDRFIVVRDRTSHLLLGLEWELSPGELVRVGSKTLGKAAVSDGAPDEWHASEVHLTANHRRLSYGVAVRGELATSLVTAGCDPSMFELVDEALSARHDIAYPTTGTVLRLVADATFVDGEFDRYDDLVALEIRPGGKAPPIRLYHGKEHAKDPKAKGFFDNKAHSPVSGKWHFPIAGPRITSRFNPKRMHPVLHVVTPHNGVDFGASVGTPVYAIAAGTVIVRGEVGPSGNLISISHEGGYESGYAHLSRFAPGVTVGGHVEARTLIGYVGTTGRSTGPHLHLGVKRNSVFIDPLSLKMDAVKVVAASDRGPFQKRRAEADAALDAIVLPNPAPPEPSVAPTPGSSADVPLGEESEGVH